LTLLDPVWLVLALPLFAALWRFPLPSRLTNGMRVAAVVCVLLAAAGVAVRLPSRAGTVVVVADRSRSMPPGSDAAHKELIDLLHAGMGGDDRLAVVSFGQTVAVERAGEADRFPGFTHEVGADASNLSEAVETALSIVPKDTPGRVLVLSDGRWTGREPSSLAGLAAARGVGIDYRHRGRAAAGDLAVARVDAPAAVAAGEGFLLTAWVQSPVEQDIKFEVTRAGKVIAAGDRRVSAGLTRLTFRDRAGDPGSQDYRVRVAAAGDDPVPENNTARVLVGVTGPRPVLHLTPGPVSGLTTLLKAGGLDVRPVPAGRIDFTLEALSGYSGVIIENVPAETVGTRGMETLATWVRASGSGLLVTGGKHSYGPGGYYKSPLEPVLPVSMELRQEHRKLALAIVVALDRSGSMTAPVGGGKVKMDLANLGTVQVLDLLGPMDEFGCYAVDTVAHVVADLGLVTNKEATRGKILGIQSMGGGIYTYTALRAAAEMIQKAKAGTKHIILFADAADAEEPGDYVKLLEVTSKAGITVSVIGLGKDTDKDAEFLRDVAKRGGGRLFITDKPEELPRLFAQDTFVVARNAFLDESVRVRPTPGLAALAGRPFALDRPIGGYNLCYLRPEATPGAVTVDEYKAPVVASWQVGSGRVLCYTGEADGEYAGAFARSPEAGEFYATLARWTAGRPGPLGGGMAITQEVRNGVSRVRLHLDPDRKAEPFAGTPTATVLRAKPGEAPRAEALPLTWTGPDTLAAEVSLAGEETALTTVTVPGQPPQALTPVCLPYSPEYAPGSLGGEEADRGRDTLDRLARATGGVERVELSGVWHDLPRRPRSFPLVPWLLAAAVVLVLLEVLERRTGLVAHACQWVWGATGLVSRLRRRQRAVTATAAAPATATRSAVISAAPVTAPAQTPEPSTAPPQPPSGGMLDALKEARDRTRR
jgi:Mg-chelatase subunit ChlD